MKHLFDIEIAVKYGVNAAILLENLGYWIKQNEANQTNFYDGYYWTYNSRKAYREIFPYMSERQINTAFQKLIDYGLVITGNYNKSSYDRTLWYALTQKGKCILHFDIMDDDKISNGDSQNVRPIPDINTDINSFINTDIYASDSDDSKKNQKHISVDCEKISSLFNDICKSYPKVQKMSEARKKTIKARFNEGYTMEDFKTLFENAEKSSFLKGQANSEWSANFDWLIKGSNIAKVIDGNYGDKQKPQAERIGDLDDLF